MAKKRKRTSVASFVHHLERASTSSPASSHAADEQAAALNLGAYHPELDVTSLDAADLSEYEALLQKCLVHPAMFPPNMLKYWRHRFTLLSSYAAGCLLDEQSWYSITPESVAFRIAKRCATDGIVVDLFAGAGGNAIQFAFTCNRVLAIEIDPLKLRLARWNAKIYGVEDRITFVQGDSIELLDVLVASKSNSTDPEDKVWKDITHAEIAAVQAVFLSPPWGGVQYAQNPTASPSAAPSTYSLSSIQPVDGSHLFARVQAAFNTSNIAYYLPRNTDLEQLQHLAQHTLIPPYKPNVKIEYQYVNNGTKLSSLTAYYGSLAADWNDESDDWYPTAS